MTVNQRVRVYATLCGVVAETKGAVIAIREDGMLHVRLDGPEKKVIVAHPKQCRKLNRRERRRVWISQFQWANSCSTVPARINRENPFHDGIEFVEVRR